MPSVCRTTNFSRTAPDALTMYLWTCTRGTVIMAMEAYEITEEADGLWRTIPKQNTKNTWHKTVGLDEEIVRAYIRNQKQEDARYDQMKLGL